MKLFDLKNIIIKKIIFFKYLFIITLLKICFSFCDCIVLFYDICIIILLIINNYLDGNEKDKNIKQSIFYGISVFYLATILSSFFIIISEFIPIIGFIIDIILNIPYLGNFLKGAIWLATIPNVYLILKFISSIANSTLFRIIFCTILILLYYNILLPIFSFLV
jgi:hypothetical protein